MPQLIANVTKRYPTTLGHIHYLAKDEEFYAAPKVAEALLEEGLASLAEEQTPTAVVDPGVPTPEPTPVLDQEKINRIVEAMQTILEAGDESALTTAGEPRVKELEALLEEDTNADERKAAWELVESA